MDLIRKIFGRAHLYVAQVFQGNEADENTTLYGQGEFHVYVSFSSRRSQCGNVKLILPRLSTGL